MNATRRGFLGGVAGAAAVLSGVPRLRAAEGKTIGFIYVGSKDDYGWNQSHAVAAAALKGLPGITVVEEENVPETDAVAKTMESMINLDGASLLFPTSFGYFNPFMLDEAKKYPDIEFRHPTGLWNKDKDPMNAGGYYSYMDQGHYVNGVAAGLATKTNKIGYIAAKPIGLVLRNVNSFTVGVKKVNPAAQIHLIITGDWSLPVREAEIRPGAYRHRMRRHRVPCRQSQGRDRNSRSARGEDTRSQCRSERPCAQGLHHRR